MRPKLSAFERLTVAAPPVESRAICVVTVPAVVELPVLPTSAIAPLRPAGSVAVRVSVVPATAGGAMSRNLKVAWSTFVIDVAGAPPGMAGGAAAGMWGWAWGKPEFGARHSATRAEKSSTSSAKLVPPFAAIALEYEDGANEPLFSC